MTEWVAGAAPPDYDLMVYNEAFIRDNIQSYGNIPGVFTITQQNATIKAEVDRLTVEKAGLETRVKTLTTAITEEQDKQQKIDAAYEKAVWDITEASRTQYRDMPIKYAREMATKITAIHKTKP